MSSQSNPAVLIEMRVPRVYWIKSTLIWENEMGFLENKGVYKKSIDGIIAYTVLAYMKFTHTHQWTWKKVVHGILTDL